jgi:ABC-2 type transport system permease protein
MSWLHLVRSEIHKLTTTKMPWAFVSVLAVIASINAIAIMFGTDADGSKAFISTTADQRSLLSFASNAMMIAGLFGAIAAGREYSHNTVVPTFLIAPRRTRTTLAQQAAIVLGGVILGIVGSAFTIGGAAIALALIDRSFLLSTGDVMRLIAACALAGGMGALLGAGVGELVRNVGGAVVAAVLLLLVIPPVAVQLSPDVASWVPSTLGFVVSGVGEQPSAAAAALAMCVWGALPALVGLIAVRRRDVV